MLLGHPQQDAIIAKVQERQRLLESILEPQEKQGITFSFKTC
jgi:hypothetical protein